MLILTGLYVLVNTGLQGVVSPSALQAHSTDALVYTAQAIGGPAWGRVMAVALALSVIAATGTSVVLTARIVYGMASRRTLPGRLANVSARFKTPVDASVWTAALIIVITWVYTGPASPTSNPRTTQSKPASTEHRGLPGSLITPQPADTAEDRPCQPPPLP